MSLNGPARAAASRYEFTETVERAGAGVTVPKIVRETVETVRRLLEDCDGEPLTIKAVREGLNLDYQPTYRRVQMALEVGYLRNLEERERRSAQLIMGDPLPEDRKVLPDPKELEDERFDPEPTTPMIIAYLQARGVKLRRDGYLSWQPAEEQGEAALEVLRLEWERILGGSVPGRRRRFNASGRAFADPPRERG